MLQELELEVERPGSQAELGPVDRQDRGVADMGPDQALHLGDALGCDRGLEGHDRLAAD